MPHATLIQTQRVITRLGERQQDFLFRSVLPAIGRLAAHNHPTIFLHGIFGIRRIFTNLSCIRKICFLFYGLLTDGFRIGRAFSVLKFWLF